jgi:hypothetical protein
MEQTAKSLLKRISDQVSTFTDKKISQVSHASRENEWRAYICQSKPHWEDIAWRVKEPNVKGEAEVHLGFYSALPNELLADTISEAEKLSKGTVSHLVKNENGIRLVWKVNLIDEKYLEKVFTEINNLLGEFLHLTLAALINSDIDNEISTNQQFNEQIETGNNDILLKITDAQMGFLESNSWWDKEKAPTDWTKSRKFIFEAVKKDGRWIELANEDVKNDIEIVSIALTESGSALEYVSEEMKNNKDVVLIAVSKDGNALEYASDSLKSDKEVIIKAVNQSFNALGYANGDVLENLEFVIELFKLINKDNYKDLFFKLSHSMRIEKNVLELISPVYRNANNWNDAKYSQTFLDYLTYFDSQDPYKNEDNLMDFTDDYEIPLSSNHFESLRDEFEILIFEIDNSNYAWEELGGSESFTVIYNLNKNVIIPNKKKSPNEDDLSLIKRYQYLDSMHVGIYDPYHDNQRFDGRYSISNYFEDITKNEKSYNISYHGEHVDNYSCDIDTLNKVNIAITPVSMFHFISDVFRNF